MPWHFDKGVARLSLLAIFSLLLPAIGARATSTWNVGSGNWSVAGNWSPSGVPGASAVVDITNSDAINRTITYDYTGAAVTLNLLTVDNSGGGTDTFSMPANNLTSTAEYVGYSGGIGNGISVFDQTGGANTIGSDLYLGVDAADQGTYNLTSTGGANILNDNGAAFIGYSGTGNFNDTAAAYTSTFSGSVFVGYNAGSSGTFTVGGSGSLSVFSSIQLGSNLYVGGNGVSGGGKGVVTVQNGSITLPTTGILTVYNTSGSGLFLDSGTVTTGSLNLSGNPALFNWSTASGGTLDLTNESITIDSAAGNFGDSTGSFSSFSLSTLQVLQVSGSETVGLNGTGTVTQTGENTVGTNLYIGYNLGSVGSYTLSGPFSGSQTGFLTVNGNVYVGGNASAAGGKGTLSVVNGANLAMPSTGSLTVYNTAGSSLIFSGGSITTGALNLSGNTSLFNWTAGSLSLANESITIDNTSAANFGDLAENAGAFTLSSSQSLSVTGNEYIGYNGSASFTQSGGTNSILGGNILALGYNAGSSGTYNLSGAAVLTCASNGEAVGYQGTGTFNQTGGTNIIGSAANSGGLIVGGLPGSGNSVYTLSGSGSLSVTGIEAIGVFTTGVFNQTGGTNTILTSPSPSQLSLGYDPGGSGTYNLSGGSVSVAGNVNVGGNAQSIGGTGVFNISGGAILTTTGSLVIYNSPGDIVKLNGGTINAAALDFNGAPSLLNWISGTINLTSNVTWDSAASNTTTSDAFLNSLTLVANQTLMISGNETVGGVGSFGLTLNSGSTHNVTGSITLNPTGSIAQNAGSTLYYSTFTQAGGTVNGTLQNQGEFIYQSGLFSGRLINQGSLILGASFTAGNGIENDTSMSLSSGQTITVNGAGLDNLGFFSLFGGVIDGTTAVNDFSGTMNGNGTINAPFINDGNLSVNGVLRFGSTFSNAGTVQGSGDVIGSFSNLGGGSVDVNTNQTLAISSAWSNSSLITLAGTGAVLDGGAITNTGTIQGDGTINSPITNSTGVIRASGGELDLGGAGNTNGASAQIQAATGDAVLEIQGLATNAGEIALTGGTFDNNNRTITNTGYISGNGVFRSGGLTNNGFVVLGGNSNVYGPVTNGATGAINAVGPGSAAFFGPVTNSADGNITVQSGANVTFFNSFTGTSPISNGGTITFSVASSSGAITGGGQTIVGNGVATILKMAVTSGDSMQSSLVISDGSTLDITNNTFFIDYGSGADPITTVAAELQSGYNAGGWNGPGIISSVAATTPGYGVGYADSADPSNPAGLALDTVEIKYTLLGDANLDGIVNGVDFGILAANFNKGVTGWDRGDFNYDNSVNGVDFGYLAANFDKGVSGADIGGSALSDPALVAFAEANGLMADVPEPAQTSLMIVGLASLGSRWRRRRQISPTAAK
jgi:hypothetical protein